MRSRAAKESLDIEVTASSNECGRIAIVMGAGGLFLFLETAGSFHR